MLWQLYIEIQWKKQFWNGKTQIFHSKTRREKQTRKQIQFHHSGNQSNRKWNRFSLYLHFEKMRAFKNKMHHRRWRRHIVIFFLVFFEKLKTSIRKRRRAEFIVIMINMQSYEFRFRRRTCTGLWIIFKFYQFYAGTEWNFFS